MPAGEAEAELSPEDVLDWLHQARSKAPLPWMRAALLKAAGAFSTAYAAYLEQGDNGAAPAGGGPAAEEPGEVRGGIPCPEARYNHMPLSCTSHCAHGGASSLAMRTPPTDVQEVRKSKKKKKDRKLATAAEPEEVRTSLHIVNAGKVPTPVWPRPRCAWDFVAGPTTA